MTDWATISSLATGAGTLVLAVATFASVRSANRSARIAEQTLQEQRRPVLMHSRLDDPLQKIGFADGHWVRVSGSAAAAEHNGDVVYLAISLRNVGAGIAVLQGWNVRPGLARSDVERTPEEQFRRQGRDLYIPPGDIGLWQGALRDGTEVLREDIATAIGERQTFTVELLYTDQVGGQRTVTRFNITPMTEEGWLASVGHHWRLDAPGPR